jgi:tetratricopeptide (TPR) repeat protein
MKRLIARPALLLAVLLALPVQIGAQDLKSAILLTRSEQYDKAAAALNDLIQKEPANGRNYFYLGENILSEYFSDTISNSLAVAAKEAQSAFQSGVKANANDPLNYVGLAKVAYLQGDNRTADEMRTKAKSFLMPYKRINKKLSPPAPEYALTLGKIAESYIKNDDVDTSKALPLIREAIRIDPTNTEVYLTAGDIWILKNEGSKAISYYSQAEYTDPQSPTAAMKKGNIYVKGRAFTAAVPYFEQAIELNANYAPAYRELGQLYLNSGVYDKARQYFEKYLELTAGNIPAKSRYATSLFYGKDYDGVIRTVEEIFKVDQSRQYLNRLAGYSAYDKNPPDYDQALSYMERLFKTLDPERIIQKDYLYLARILVKKNADYSKMTEELNSLRQQLEKEKGRSSAANAAEKAKIRTGMTQIESRIADLNKRIEDADAEISRAFEAYHKALEFKPDDRALMSEMGIQYYTFRRYNDAAKTWAKMIDPAKDNTDDLMRIGRAYYAADNLESADSVFNVIIKNNPDYIPAYLMIANTQVKKDPEMKSGLAKPRFEQILRVAQKDSVANAQTIMDALTYLSHYHMVNENLGASREYYNRMVNLSNNKDFKVRGYNGLALIELRALTGEKTNEGRLSYLSRARELYNRVLALDPNNAIARNQMAWVAEYEASIKKGINPNEIRGTVKNGSGEPIAYASVRVKDTAAENLTNPKGEFRFEIPGGSETLIISAKGYRTVEIPLTKSRIYTIVLEQ